MVFYVFLYIYRWHSSVGSVGGVAQLVVASSLTLKGIGFDPGREKIFVATLNISKLHHSKTFDCRPHLRGRKVGRPATTIISMKKKSLHKSIHFSSVRVNRGLFFMYSDSFSTSMLLIFFINLTILLLFPFQRGPLISGLCDRSFKRRLPHS